MVSGIRTTLKRALATALSLSFLIAPGTGLRSIATAASITDSSVHAPPTSGTYAYYATYGTFGPDQSGFPGVGQSFVDPVFGSTIHRLTNELNQQSQSEIYSKNGYFNADGTLAHHRSPSGHTIINTTTGQVVRSGVAFNYDSSFAPDDPDSWYYFAWGDTTLYKYSVSSGAATVVKTFAGALGQLGGSVDWIDRTGRYMVVHVGGTFTIYDKQADVLYAGGVPDTFMGGAVSQGGWVGISPDANYIISSTPPVYSHSWKIDHTNQVVSTTPVLFWTLCGGHGDVMSASDGKTYYVTFDCNSTGSIYRADVSLPQSASNVSQQLSQNKKLVQLASWSDVDGHFSRVSKGAFSDWVFASVESGDDGFSSTVSGWRAYEQELLMMNVLTGEVRRLAHHRSRGLSGSYYYQPRVDSSWDAGMVLWTSNFGYSASGYADLYGISNPGGDSSTSTPPPAPAPALAVSFGAPGSGATVSGTTNVSLAASGGSGSGYVYGLKIDGAAVTLSGASFSWNTTGVANGTHTLTASVTDSAGATATASESVTVQNTTTTSNPTVSFTNPASGATVSGTVTVSVSASGGSGTGYTYTVLAGTRTIYNGSGSTFSWNTTTAANGTVTLSAKVTDSTGHTGTATRTVTVSNTTTKDTTPPKVSITSPKSGVWTGNSIQVAASGTDNVALSRIDLWGAGKVFASLPCSGTTCGGSTWWITGPLAAGAYVVNAVAVDKAGNQTTSAAVTIYKDATSPTIASGAPAVSTVTAPTSPLTASFTSPASGATVRGTVTVGMADSGASGSSTFKLSVDGTQVSSQTVSGSTATYAWATTGLANGSHTLAVSVTDGGGRTASASRSVTVSNTSTASGDTTPPTVAITSPPSGVWTGNSLNVSVTASDNVAVKTIQLYSDGSLFATVPCAGATCSSTVLWLTGSLSSGQHSLTAVATDTSGNTATTASVTINK